MNAIDGGAATTDRATAWALAAVILVGAALRIHFLDSGLWFDEIVTLVDSARAPLAQIVTHFPSNNDHPLYSVLAHISIVAFGEDPWSLRLPAVIFGLAAMPMLYVFAIRVTNRFEALSAAMLLAVSYHHVWFSQNARGYTILLFCALLGTHLLLIGLRENRRVALVGFAMVSSLAAYTHLTMVLVVVGQALVVACYLLARRGWRTEFRDWLNPALGFALAGLLTLLLYAPMLLDVQKFFGVKSEGARVASAGWAILETLRGLQLGYTMGGAIVIAGLLFFAGCWSYLRQSPTLLGLFLVPGAVLFAVAVLLQRPTFPRFFFFAAGFALLIVVRGIVVIGDWIARRLLGGATGERVRKQVLVVLIAGAVVVSALALPVGYRYPKQDYEQALKFLEGKAAANDVVVLAGGGVALPFQKYYEKAWKRIASAAELASTRQQSNTVWLAYTFKPYIETLEPNLMNAILAYCPPVKTFPGTVVGGNIVVTKCSAI